MFMLSSLKGGECYFCRQTLYNAKEAFKHRGGCRVFQISQAIVSSLKIFYDKSDVLVDDLYRLFFLSQ